MVHEYYLNVLFTHLFETYLNKVEVKIYFQVNVRIITLFYSIDRSLLSDYLVINSHYFKTCCVSFLSNYFKIRLIIF